MFKIFLTRDLHDFQTSCQCSDLEAFDHRVAVRLDVVLLVNLMVVVHLDEVLLAFLLVVVLLVHLDVVLPFLLVVVHLAFLGEVRPDVADLDSLVVHLRFSVVHLLLLDSLLGSFAG